MGDKKMGKIRVQKMAFLVTSLTLFACLSFGGGTAAGENKIKIHDPEISEICNELFDALKSGDTVALALLFEGELFENNRELLEQNEGYPEFLRDYYEGASFKILETTPDGDGVMVGFTIDFPDGRREARYLHLATRGSIKPEKSKANRGPEARWSNWGITKQVKDAELEEKRRRGRSFRRRLVHEDDAPEAGNR
jgi:hypothetical protein